MLDDFSGRGNEVDEDGETHVLVVDDMLQPGRTYGADHEPAPGRASDLATLPDGNRAYRPRIEGLAAGTFEDWIRQTPPKPAPRDVSPSRPLEWLSRADWEGLVPPDSRAPRWPAFRKRFPKSSGWIHLGDVGFSPSHDEALLQASHSGDGSSSGFWFLLRRQGGRWVVVERPRTWIACGCFSTQNLTTDDPPAIDGRGR